MFTLKQCKECERFDYLYGFIKCKICSEERCKQCVILCTICKQINCLKCGICKKCGKNICKSCRINVFHVMNIFVKCVYQTALIVRV